MQDVIEFVTNPAKLSVVFGVLFFVSEALSYIPSIKANGVFQFIVGLIKKGHDKFPQ